MPFSMKSALSAAGLTAFLVPAMSWAQSTLVTAKLNGDDQWKMYLSTQPANDGFQFANGFGWGVTYGATMLLPLNSAGKHFPDYWINVWVQDVGGGGPDWIGAFKLSGAPGCRFDNGTTTLLTDATSGYWLSSKAQSPSPGGPAIPGFPTWTTNYTPPFVQPTLPPTDLGPNGTLPWGALPGLPATARWMSDPGVSSFMEAWFQAHIRCKK